MSVNEEGLLNTVLLGELEVETSDTVEVPTLEIWLGPKKKNNLI